jgi:hypothetical protein
VKSAEQTALARLDAAIERTRENLDALIEARAAIAGEPTGGLTEAERAEVDALVAKRAARLRRAP